MIAFSNGNSFSDEKIAKTLPYLFRPNGQNNKLMGGDS